MLNIINKISCNKRGFTLVEVMIGMMILTVAIVSASNLLTGIIDSNRNNLTTLQAYYLSQEGLEMVRNIRDTNWLHNKDWLGKDSEALWGGKFEVGKEYAVEMRNASASGIYSQPDQAGIAPTMGSIGGQSPWRIGVANSVNTKLYKHGISTNPSLDSVSQGADPDANFNFERKIIISDYKCDDLKTKSNIPCPDDKGGMAAYVLVQSKVEWTIGSKPRELILSEVLSNWKGGAL
jgi:prepilin-type N-terminal cleavage/methylation domain-containing protein